MKKYTVRDGSWTITCLGDNKLVHKSGLVLAGINHCNETPTREFEILARDCVLPTENLFVSPDKPNDTIIRCIETGEISFIRFDFLKQVVEKKIITYWDEEALKAITDSIEYWTDILVMDKQEEGTKTCPCCLRYNIDSISACKGCPIAYYQGFAGCTGTPYILWARHQKNTHNSLNKRVHCFKCAELAKNEIIFLKKIKVKMLKDNGNVD